MAFPIQNHRQRELMHIPEKRVVQIRAQGTRMKAQLFRTPPESEQGGSLPAGSNQVPHQGHRHFLAVVASDHGDTGRSTVFLTGLLNKRVAAHVRTKLTCNSGEEGIKRGHQASFLALVAALALHG